MGNNSAKYDVKSSSKLADQMSDGEIDMLHNPVLARPQSYESFMASTEVTFNGHRPEDNGLNEKAFLEFCSRLVAQSYRTVFKPSAAIDDSDDTPNHKKQRWEDFDITNAQANIGFLCVRIHQENIQRYQRFFRDHAACKKYGEEFHDYLDRIIKSNQKRFKVMFKKTLQDILIKFADWSDRLQSLQDTALASVPVKRRITPITEPKRVEALCAFKVKDVDVCACEELTLLDNSDESYWLVRTDDTNIEETVPSLYLAMTPPDKVLAAKAKALNEDFLDELQRMIDHLSTEYGYDEAIEALTKMGNNNNGFDNALTSWSSCILSSVESLLSQGTRNKLKRSKHRKRPAKRVIEIKTQYISELVTEDVQYFFPEYTDYTGEEVTMFVIAGVVDPNEFNELSLQEAKEKGIIEFKQGLYCNPLTGDQQTITQAMNEGLIRVEQSVTKRNKERVTKHRAGSYENLLEK